MIKRNYPSIRIGYLKREVSLELGINKTGVIYVSLGAIKHIRRNHYKQFYFKGNNEIVELMKKIVEKPTYRGVHYRDNEYISLEFIKKIDKTILLLGIEIDIASNYIYVRTMYPISEKKFNNRLLSNKIYIKKNI